MVGHLFFLGSLYDLDSVSEFCMSMSYHIRQLVPRGTAAFLLKRLIFLVNGKNCHSLVFTMLQIHIKIKSLFEYKSVWSSGCIFRSYSCSNLIALSPVRVSKVSNLLIFFSLILNLCTVLELIITDLSYFVFTDFSGHFD